MTFFLNSCLGIRARHSILLCGGSGRLKLKLVRWTLSTIMRGRIYNEEVRSGGGGVILHGRGAAEGGGGYCGGVQHGGW